jgi:hypothetical protein
MIGAIVTVLSDAEICDDDVTHFLYTGIYGKKKINQNQIKEDSVL